MKTSAVTPPQFQILLETADYLAINKETGLPTQAPPQFPSLERQVRDYLLASTGGSEPPYLGVPHRLDRCSSGVILFAKTPRAARKIARQFEHREVQKTYWCCVEREFPSDRGTWVDHVKKVYGHPRAEIVPQDHPGAQVAIMHFEVLTRFSWGALLRIELETGRTHQVRLQAASRGHYVLGDVFYGGSVQFGEPQSDDRLRAIALHARSLTFLDVETRQPIQINAPLPTAWQEWIGDYVPSDSMHSIKSPGHCAKDDSRRE